MTKESWINEYYPKDVDEVTEAEAVAHSLQKWIGVRVKNLVNHGLTNPPIRIDASTCALCELYYDKITGCEECPLFKHLGYKCDAVEMDAPWCAWLFADDPEPMIKALWGTPEAQKESK